MKGLPVQEGRHNCLNCVTSMHGGLCGHEYPDGLPEGIDRAQLVSRFSEHGKANASKNRNDALLCFICYNAALSLHVSKSPTGPTSDEVPAPASTIARVDGNSDSDALKPAASTNSLTQSGDMQPNTDTTIRDLPIDDHESPGIQIPSIQTEEECQEASEEEFRTQFYANLEKRLAESRANSENFCPLFKTKAEALEII